MQELEAAACAMGYGSVKYADLKNQRMTNYKFDFDDMLNLQGNTAVYLLYAHARIAGIIRKAGVDVAGAPPPYPLCSFRAALPIWSPTSAGYRTRCGGQPVCE